jgi:UDP-N-acetylglucosamine transferase subunit ALG13
MRPTAVGTFITVGNATQQFDRLFDLVSAIQELLPKPVVVQYGRSNQSISSEFTCEFLKPEEFKRFIADASVIICHGGAGTLLDVISAGKKPIVVPRRKEHGEIVDNHQLELVEKLASFDRILTAESEQDMRTALRSNHFTQDSQSLSQINGASTKLANVFKKIQENQ